MLDGLYIGAFGGYASLNATLVTPATSMTTTVPVQATIPTPLGPQTAVYNVPATIQVPSQRLKNQGGSGAIFGVRLGYGRILWDEAYLGAELDVTFPQLAEANLQVLGRPVKAGLWTEGSLYFRAGWTPNRQTLFFIRGGIAVPRQVVQSGAFKAERWSATPAIGVGIEHALTEHLLARADITVMPAVTDNQMGSLRGTIGIAYRF
jgi:hypothetical protein